MMNQRYAYSVLVRLLAIAISSIGTLFLLPLILRTLGEYNFGIWGMVSSITGYLLLLDFGIALACTRYLSMQQDNQEKWTEIISNSLLLSLLVTLFLLTGAAGVFIAMQTGIIPDQHQLLSTIIIITLIEVAISIPLRLYMSILRTEVRYFDIGLFEVIRVILRIGGITLGLYLGANLIDIVIIGSAANLVFFILPLLSIVKRYKSFFFSRHAFSKPSFHALLGFSKSTAVSQAAEFLKFRTDSVLVAAFIGITASAHYTIIVFIVVMLTQVLMRFLSYWDTIIIGYIGKKNHAKSLETLFKSLETGTVISFISVVNVIIFGETFIHLWIGKEYIFLHTPLILLTCILPAISFQMATTPYFNAIGKQKINARHDFSEVILKLLLIIPMSSLFGLNGFIYSSLISAITFSICFRLYSLTEENRVLKTLIYKKYFVTLSRYLTTAVILLIIYKIILITTRDQQQAQVVFFVLQLLIISSIIYKVFIIKRLEEKTI